MKSKKILEKLKSLSNPKSVEGMARYGINPKNTLGISIPTLQKMAKEIGKDHTLSQKLWKSGIHEARILASMIDDLEAVTEEQMEKWAADFDSWDVCDQTCKDLFEKTPFAYEKCLAWSLRKEEFVKRAAFSFMARLAISDKKADDKKFERFLPVIMREATDERNYVKKAVGWALRQIGKRNKHLNRIAIETANEIQKMDSKGAHWIASDTLRELQGEKVKKILKKHSLKGI